MAATRPLRVRSYAKVNLGLEVLGTRADGYHELRTIFQTIGVHDDIVLRPRDRRRHRRAATTPACPWTRRTSLSAPRATCSASPACARASRSRSPSASRWPAAWAAAARNAAAVLMGLDRLWRLGLGPAGLHPLARRLGADVPYFLVGGTALGLARGDEVYPLWRQVRGRRRGGRSRAAAFDGGRVPPAGPEFDTPGGDE